MLRRSFLGAVASVLVTPLAILKGSTQNTTKEGPLLIINDESAKRTLSWGDYKPFIKIYTKDGLVIKYKKYNFKQRNNRIYCYRDCDPTLQHLVPISIKIDQKIKDDFLKELAKDKRYDNATLFEIIADNGKSNLYAIGGDGPC